ncbi:Tetraspanin-11 [Amphibalanus amphitrite]|uniref:Tetraspanin n=1 Tax=Amphibalanus amphitrite TaxID=1232801 RepID=A0A6A4X0S5_AMPAM|nr:Tetraspanin-11 [Amphibalanus amphitrite]
MASLLSCASQSFLLFFIFIYWASGCALLLLGTALLVDSSRQLLFFLVNIEDGQLLLPTFRLLCVGLVLIGTFKLLVGLLGCLGAVKQDYCIVAFYFCFVAITMCSEITVGAFSHVHQQRTDAALAHTLGRKLAKYYGVPDRGQETMAIDFAQYKFQCCGVQSPSDYNYSRWRVEELGGAELRVPLTCCTLREDAPQPYRNPHPRDPETCQKRDPLQHHSQRHTQGCLQGIARWLDRESTVLTSVGVATGCVDLICAVITLCWCRQISANRAVKREAWELTL